MLPELMIVMAVATVQLDSDSFKVREESSKLLSQCNVLAGFHLEIARKSILLEVKRRADKLWLKLPDFYAYYRVTNEGILHENDFHAAAVERFGGSINISTMTKFFWDAEKKGNSFIILKKRPSPGSIGRLEDGVLYLIP